MNLDHLLNCSRTMTSRPNPPAETGLLDPVSVDSLGPDSALPSRTRRRVHSLVISRSTSDGAGWNTHPNRLHRLSTNIPITLNLAACHTLRQQSLAGACRLPESPGTLAERISWGSLGYPGVLGDMAGQAMGLSNEPEPKDRFCCEMEVLSYRTVLHDPEALTFSSRPWHVLSTVVSGY